MDNHEKNQRIDACKIGRLDRLSMVNTDYKGGL